MTAFDVPMPWHSTSQPPVVILGASRTGVATARFLNALGVACLLSDAQPIKPAFESDVAELQARGVQVEWGGHAQAQGAQQALVVVSPGLKPSTPLLQALQAQQCTLTSDVALALRFLQDFRPAQKTVAITGTNGKTTTTMLLTHVLNALHSNLGDPLARTQTAIACGNVGIAVFDVLHQAQSANQWPEVLVFEISSAQWHYAQSLLPHGWPWTVALLSGFEADHLDWHGSLDAYAAAKIALFPKAQHVVLPVGCSLNEPIQSVLSSKTRCILAGPESSGADLVFQAQSPFELILQNDTALASLANWTLAGAHNRQNAAMAAWTAWLLCQPSHQALSDALCRFPGVAHRLERFALPQADILVFNDSKSTTPGATMTALKALQEDACRSHRPLHLLMGGRDKNTPLDELALALQEAACHWRLTIWLYGEAAQRFADALSPLAGQPLRVNCQDGFQAAVSGAFAMALTELPDKPVILLSPACASFDEFSDYEARGRAFKRLAAENIKA